MSLRVNHNLLAMNAARNLYLTDAAFTKSLEKLSSGLRINRAADDAAGLAISEKMRAQINGLNQAVRNAQDGISLIQTAEGAMGNIQSILQRTRELAVQAASDGTTDADRAQIQKEVDELAKQITDIANTTQFNTKRLLTGEFSEGQTDLFIQTGANKGENLGFNINAVDAATLGVVGYVGNLTSYNVAASVDSVGPGLQAGSTYDIVFTAGAAKNVSGTIGLLANNGTAADFTVGTSVASGDYTLTLTDKTNNIWTLTRPDGSTESASASSGEVAFLGGALKIKVATDLTSFSVGDKATFTIDAAKVELKSGGTTIGTAVFNPVAGSQIVLGSGENTVVVTLNSTLPTADSSDTFSVAKDGESASATNQWRATTNSGISVSTQGAANAAIKVIDDAINIVSGYRANLGALQNRLEHTISNLQITSENLSAAESRIRDVDMAEEMMNFTRNQILQQAGTAMLAQANAAPQTVLSLIR